MTEPTTIPELEPALTGQIPSGVYWLETNASVEVIEAFVLAHNFCFLYLDGTHIADGNQFYRAFGFMIDYPDFVRKGGANANQFWDVLRDLEMWTPKCQQEISGYIVLYDRFDPWYQNKTDRTDLYGIDGTIGLINVSYG